MKDDRTPAQQVCERLGDLLTAAVPDEQRAPDTRQWTAIEVELDRHGARRWWRWPALATAALVLVTSGTWLIARRPLAYRAEHCALATDGTLTAGGAGAIAFTDGSTIALAAGTRLHVEPLPYARGAEIALDDGEATLTVIHRANARWAVTAGPFRVDVTGTRFSVHWSKRRGSFRIAMQEGEVHVRGGRLAGDTILRAGQVLASSTGEPVPAPSTEAPSPSPPADAAASPAAPPPTRTAPPPWRRKTADPRETETPHPTSPALPELGPQVRPLPIVPTPSIPPPGEPSSAPRPSGPRRITIAPDGSLGNGISGFAWVAAAPATTLSSPVTSEEGASLARLAPKDGELCVSGTMAGLHCVNAGLPSVRCNWRHNWGVQIGFLIRTDQSAWGERAPNAIAVDYHGRSNTYRLNVHRHGDPDAKLYCIYDYESGKAAKPSMFKTECWADTGETLPDFESVDSFNLMLPSGMEYAAFRYCVSGIRLLP